jgi:hypothetical protein
MGTEDEGLSVGRGHAGHARGARGRCWRIKIDDGLQGRALEQVEVGEVARRRLGDGPLRPNRRRLLLWVQMMRGQLRLGLRLHVRLRLGP